MKTRIYYPGKIALGEPLHLPKEQSHHLATVLRASAGESVIIFNGEGGEYECEIESIQKNAVIINIKNHVNISRESPLSIILAQGISRGERMDYTVQKATELGVSEIQPMFTEYSNVKLAEDRVEKKTAHWQAIAISAAEQSGRTSVPIVKPPINFPEALKLKGSLMIGDTEASEPINALAAPNPPVILLIGPEGGFAPQEIQAATQAGAKRISLGPRILRTETAGMIAIALLQNTFGDL